MASPEETEVLITEFGDEGQISQILSNNLEKFPYINNKLKER